MVRDDVREPITIIAPDNVNAPGDLRVFEHSKRVASLSAAHPVHRLGPPALIAADNRPMRAIVHDPRAFVQRRQVARSSGQG